VAKQSTAKQARQDSSAPETRAQSAKQKSAAPNLDRLIHESLTFSDLKNLMNTTDGNLSVHARKLEEAGYISCSKFFEGRLPKTEYKLTAAGRSALENYLSHMESLIKQMRST
jgi:DNA-binding HxlR family transcriptional regulator